MLRPRSEAPCLRSPILSAIQENADLFGPPRTNSFDGYGGTGPSPWRRHNHKCLVTGRMFVSSIKCVHIVRTLLRFVVICPNSVIENKRVVLSLKAT